MIEHSLTISTRTTLLNLTNPPLHYSTLLQHPSVNKETLSCKKKLKSKQIILLCEQYHAVEWQ